MAEDQSGQDQSGQAGVAKQPYPKASSLTTVIPRTKKPSVVSLAAGAPAAQF